MARKGALFFFCGKMAAGKSTFSKKLSFERKGILISEDEWLASLYPEQIHTLKDYVQHSQQMKPLIKKLVQDILSTGVDVVMDFPANTQAQRDWLKALAEDISAHYEMFYLKVSDEKCLQRLAKRRQEQPERAKFDNEHTFRQLAQYFEAPAAEEKLNISEVSF